MQLVLVNFTSSKFTFSGHHVVDVFHLVKDLPGDTVYTGQGLVMSLCGRALVLHAQGPGPEFKPLHTQKNK